MNKFIFTSRLKELYNEIIKMGGTIEFETSDIVYQDSWGCQTPTGQHSSLITIHKDHMNEEIIAHELLHAYYQEKGFLSVDFIADETNPKSKISLWLHNAFIHELIYSEATKRGFDNSELNLRCAMYNKESLGRTVEYPNLIDNIILALQLLDIENRCKDYREFYVDELNRNFPSTVRIIKYLKEKSFDSDYNTPFQYRKAMIKCLRAIDELCINSNVTSLNLKHSMIAKYIPSKRQLDLKVKQVFDIKPNYLKENDNIMSVVISKNENQSCYFLQRIDNEQLLEQLNNLTVKQFYDTLGLQFVER